MYTHRILGGLCLLGMVLFLGEVQAKSRWQRAHKRNQNLQKLKKVLQPKRLALLVGIGKYQGGHWPALRYAHRDAQQMKRALSKWGRFDHIHVLTGRKQTTLVRIQRALQQLRRKNTSPWDTIVVYISAHGTIAYPGHSKEGARYVVTSDTSTNIPASALAVQKIRRLLETFVSRRKVLMLATCYTGMRGSKSRLAPGSKGVITYQAARRSRTMLILSAASKHQPAFESKRLQGDVYTHFFLRCLKRMASKKRTVSASRVHACAVRPTFHFVKKRFGQAQLPGLESRIDGLDAVYLSGKPLLAHKPTKKKRKPLVQLFRRQLKRWKVRFFRKGQKGPVVALQQTGELILAMDPGEYRVEMLARNRFSRRRFHLELEAGKRLILKPPARWALQGDVGAQMSAAASVPMMFGSSLALFRDFLGLRLSYGVGSGSLTSSQLIQHQLQGQLEACWSLEWGRLSLSLGGFAGGGVLLQDFTVGEFRYGPFLAYGGLIGPTYALSYDLSLSLMVQAGFTVVPFGDTWNHRFSGSLRLGVHYAL